MPEPHDWEIADGVKASDWEALELCDPKVVSPDWEKAITVLESRLIKRFFEPIQKLIDTTAPSKTEKLTYGFVILAIDFMLIETIQGFREGKLNHKGKSEELFVNFFTKWTEFKRFTKDPKGQATKIYKDGRCALLHSGGTGMVRVSSRGPLMTFNESGAIVINRTKFHKALHDDFVQYLDELRSPARSDLRSNFKKKMDYIAKMCIEKV